MVVHILVAELIQSQRRHSLDLLEILWRKIGCGSHDAFTHTDGAVASASLRDLFAPESEAN